MTINQVPLTPARWRRLAPALRIELRRALRSQSAIVDHQVLEIAQALCDRGAYDVAFALCEAIEGQPAIPYQGCGLGLLMNLRECMGEDPAPIGETLALREEEQR
jgi:hypothetical protein